MRFSYMPLPHIIRGVNSGFEGLVENVDALAAADGAWDLRIHQYDMFSHTFRGAATIDKDTLLRQQRKRIAYLRDKLLTDLAQGEKIFVVWRTEEDLTEDQVMSLFQAMRARGPGRLLWVVRQDPAGVVQEVKPGLMRGTIDRWRDNRKQTEHLYSLQGWLTVLVNAWLLSNKLAVK
jgi:hypothetical protein